MLRSIRKYSSEIDLKNFRAKYTLPDLTYDYNALEPFISADIMRIHHSKHHQAYVNNLNDSLSKLDDARSKRDLDQFVNLQQAVKFNAGGKLNSKY
jgi:Fe-Mn family superoxide dismutase